MGGVHASDPIRTVACRTGRAMDLGVTLGGDLGASGALREGGHKAKGRLVRDKARAGGTQRQTSGQAALPQAALRSRPHGHQQGVGRDGILTGGQGDRISTPSAPAGPCGAG
jgi:hypothetical protein